MQSVGSTVSHKTGLQHRRSTTHREMGIRCHQEVHPRLATVRPQQVTQISTEEHIRQLVKDQMTRSYNQFWIVHSTSGICHIPAIAENCIDNRRWHTVCGWYYGSSTFRKSFNKPTKDRCLKCFRYTEITDVQEIDLSESDEDQ